MYSVLTGDLELTLPRQFKGHILRRSHVDVLQAVLEGNTAG